LSTKIATNNPLISQTLSLSVVFIYQMIWEFVLKPIPIDLIEFNLFWILYKCFVDFIKPFISCDENSVNDLIIYL